MRGLFFSQTKMPRQKNIKLTVNNFLLDEVQSLLRKAIQRKEEKYVVSCIQELLPDKIQLPNSLLVDSLFGDHCLCDEDMLHKFYSYIHSKDKRKFIELLLDTNTCNISCCLPVISLEYKYHMWKKNAAVNKLYENLVEEKDGLLRFNMIISEFVNSWNSS